MSTEFKNTPHLAIFDSNGGGDDHAENYIVRVIGDVESHAKYIDEGSAGNVAFTYIPMSTVTASPELLEALLLITTEYSVINGDTPSIALSKAEAAIKKATGQ